MEHLAPSLMLLLLAFGLASGFLAGLLGVGGGLMLVPCLVFVLGQEGVTGESAIKMAIAVAMATILFTSLSSVWAHHRRGAIRWNIVRDIVPGIVGGGLLAGAGAFSLLKGKALGLFFTLFVGVSAYRMLRGAAARAVAPENAIDRREITLVGAGIGFVSGLVGAGGGFLSVPYMTRRHVPIHAAVATSAALGVPIALANVVGYVVSGWSLPQLLPWSWGYFYFPALVLIVAGSMATAPLGARVAHAMDVAALRRVFALMLAGLAVYMFYKSWFTL